MNSSTNLTFTIPHKEGLHAAAEIDILMTFVFIGVAAGVMAILLAGFLKVKRKEASEMKTAGVTVIPQQSLHRCPQYYLLMFYTASGRHSGTTANVFCRMYGNHHKSKPVILRDPDRAMFQPSSVSSFLVTLSRSLNQIKEIHIWHDISGPNPPWFLESVVICHLNTNVTWYFEANRWLDVSAGSKEVECRLKPLKRNVYLSTITLFDARLGDNIKNKHLWFAPFLSNKIQTFGKSDKMSCCLAVAGTMSLIATILVDSTQNVFPEESIRLGPWKFRLGDIYRAIVCAGIAFAVRLLLEFLFKNSRRKRPLQDNDMDVSEHIQDYFQRLNAIEFVDENKEMNMVQNDSSNAQSGEKILDTSENSVNKGATTNTDPAANENVSIDLFKDSIKKSIDYSDESSSMKSFNEASEVSHGGADYASADESISGVTSGYGAHTDDFESSLGNKEKKHLMKTQDIRELIDVLGNVPEKEILIDILDNEAFDV